MTLRPLRAEDFDAIKKINDSVQPHAWSVAALTSEMNLVLRAPKGQTLYLGWVVEDQSVVTGYLFSRRQGDDFELMFIGVAKNRQRRGVGRLLVEGLISQVPSNAEIFLEVSHQNAAARALYGALGFTEFNRRKNYYPDGSDGLCLKLKVAKP